MRNIAIIGCGISGLASAIFLRRSGHSVTLFERFEQPESVGAGIILQPTGMAALEHLELLTSVVAHSSRVDAMVGENRAGKVVMDVHYGDLKPGLHGLGMHRGNLFRCLYDAAGAAGAKVVTGAEIERIETHDKGVMLCATNERRIEGFDMAVVANGWQSRVTQEIDMKMQTKPYSWAALWAIVDMPASVDIHTLSQRYDTASTMIGILPSGLHPQTGKPCASFFWSLRADAYEQWLNTDLGVWRNQVTSLWPELTETMKSFTQHDQLTLANYADRVARTPFAENVVVIGDAAHAMSPQLGQGANLGLVDAWVLAECLDQFEDTNTALRNYADRRKRNIAYAQFASRLLTPVFQSDSGLLWRLRDTFFPLLNRFWFAYKEALRTIVGVKTGILFDRSIIDID